MESARQGDPGKLWITADSQASGRGRQGRTWISEPGNLYASLLLIDPADAKDLGTLPLAVSLAVRDAVAAAAPELDRLLTIKWPNDILLDGAKLAGILLESAMVGARRAVVIGCGVNCRHAPPPGEYPVTRLSDHGAEIHPHDLFRHLAEAMEVRLRQWDGARGKAAIVADWTGNASGVGQTITLRLPGRSLSGRFAGLDDDGLLLLDRPGHEVLRVSAGEVFFEPSGGGPTQKESR